MRLASHKNEQLALEWGTTEVIAGGSATTATERYRLSYQAYLSAANLLTVYHQMQDIDSAGASGIVCIPAIPIA